jgi:phosphopantothenoylcysteine synthetase/decarboxylase
MKTDNNELKIQALLKEFEAQRVALNDMVKDVEEFKKNIDALFPKTLDARSKWKFEEKIKTATSLLNVLLDIRKELIKSMRDEIEIRRRVKIDSTGGLEDLFDIRALADSVDKLQKKKLTLVKKMGDQDETGDTGPRR